MVKTPNIDQGALQTIKKLNMGNILRALFDFLKKNPVIYAKGINAIPKLKKQAVSYPKLFVTKSFIYRRKLKINLYK